MPASRGRADFVGARSRRPLLTYGGLDLKREHRSSDSGVASVGCLGLVLTGSTAALERGD